MIINPIGSGKGWHKENLRHSQARRGIKTIKDNPKVFEPKFKDEIDEILYHLNLGFFLLKDIKTTRFFRNYREKERLLNDLNVITDKLERIKQ